MVTMRWWDDLWLNEAFATWAAYWSAANATEWTDAWATFLVSQKTAGYRADGSPATHPIRQSARTVAEAAAGFDDITYLKGAGVLKQLVAYVGEEAFVAGLRSYFEKHQWGNATLDDLMTELAAASGRDLSEWTTGWLDRAGTDVITVERSGEGLVLTAEGPDGAAPTAHRLDVGLYERQGEELVRSELLALDVQGPRTPLPDRAADADMLLVNDEDLTFADVRPDAASLQALVATSGQLPSAISRAVAVSTAWNRLTTGELDASAFVTCDLNALAVESSDSLVEPFLRLAVQAADLWASGGTRERLLCEVGDACIRLAESGGARSVLAMRNLALVAVTDAHFAALEVADDDVEVQWRTLTRRAVLGRHDADAVAALVERDPDPEAWARAIIVETAQPHPEVKEAAWRTVVEERRFPLGATRKLGQAFWRPGQDDLVAPYAERYLATLSQLGEAGLMAANAIVGGLFPVVGVGEEFVERALSTAKTAGLSPMISTSLVDQVDVLRRMLASRARG
jgi:aminopeptidase N